MLERQLQQAKKNTVVNVINSPDDSRHQAKNHSHHDNDTDDDGDPQDYRQTKVKLHIVYNLLNFRSNRNTTLITSEYISVTIW